MWGSVLFSLLMMRRGGPGRPVFWEIDGQMQPDVDFRRTQAGLWVPREHYHRPTCVDLFSGCGGFSLGVISAGMQVVMGVDSDPVATQTYLHNLGSYPCDIRFTSEEWREVLEQSLEREQRRAEKAAAKRGGVVVEPFVSGGNWHDWGVGSIPVGHFYFGDVRELTGAMILDALGMEKGELDLVCGGPPCQGFSTSGKRQVMDPRNSLVFEFARLVLELRPKTMVVENVPGILSMVTPEGAPVIDALCRVLEDGGFGAFNALKRSLLASAGAGAAYRSGNPGAAKEAPDTEEVQGELFAEVERA